MLTQTTRLWILVVALAAYAVGVTVGAQVRVNDQMNAPASSLPAGMERVGNSIQFTRPSVLTILSPPQTEPTGVGQHGRAWLYCSGPNEAVKCVLKVNFFGTPLDLASGTWGLQ